ncbi:GNAT family N-acetyltransferase [Pseudomonas costantinii]|uniref:GNAT family N-acetyltransferase n=1 Tax=Pseudomonas costantinii TaxID=168469 RepID=A0A1S2V3A8_9PSED|nr:GNAT family N-acetyltransferase [Pseudomonas costantinii]NVZ20785.1 GNAT family N-acetyltransferase [Pseudomonas costantinii]OIN53224.1 GNAT family N-acetyltransferase [Pseudomonas costantinii]SED19428.1 Predicted N-acetyltransferase YhbS [Pseudomonas costantinii]
MNHAYIYRSVSAADIPAAHALSVHLKWPHREEDWAMVQRTSEGFVAELDGQLVGVAFACHQGAYSSIGLVIVSDQHQGKGIGRRLMNLCLDAAAPRTPILNATESGAPLYASMGFIEFARIQQHQGVPQTPAPMPLIKHSNCRVLSLAEYPRLIELANAGSGLDRTEVLNDLLPTAEHVVGIEVDGQLQGCALLRRFGRGHIIGPVVAQNQEQAQQLITHLLRLIPGAFVRFDILTECGLAGWLESLGLQCVDRAPRMVLGVPPQSSDGIRQFALVTQAIG